MPIDRLLGMLGLLFLGLITLRAYLVYRKTGAYPLAMTNGDSAHDFVHKLLVYIVLLEAVNAILFRLSGYALRSEEPYRFVLYEFLQPMTALEIPALQYAGLSLALIGLIWGSVAQAQMGESWRVGHDPENNTTLVTGGLYGKARHPIYFGFMFVGIGLFFAAPNALTLVCAVVLLVILSIQARIEEDYQLQRHGQAYKDYLEITRRWF